MKIKPAISYLNYLLKSKGKHSLHSPFVFDFTTKVINDYQVYNDYKIIAEINSDLLKNRNVIETDDFGSGAGNKPFATYRIAINKLAKKRNNSQKMCRLLYRTVKYFRPEHMLELGTSFGVSTLALSLGNPKAGITTVEGCATVASTAEGVFSKAGLQNIDIVIGNFDKVLANTIEKMPRLDLVFFDGNHRKAPTLDYFNQCLVKAVDQSVFIFDDIHWSAEMEEAWEIIKQHPSVSISLDCYHLGFVFFRKGIEKQHFVLKT
ncbi:MAG: class I SAM-dependent methyltransferase [Bacteroidales bacterium]|nr:class I SAM-dependent methyltransferase [Bacteroidales bacterium]